MLESKGIADLNVSVSAPLGNNPYSAIIIGGPHFSKDAAKETLDKAHKILGSNIRSDAWVQSHTLKILINRTLQKIVKP